jgi:hypothetical protein
MSSKTTLALTSLHLELDGCFLFFFEKYELHFKLSSNSYKLAFQRMPHLSVSGPSGMVFEHF